MLLVPAFTVLFLIFRGTPVLLYRGHISTAQRLPFALSSAVPALSIIVVITEIGVRAKVALSRCRGGYDWRCIALGPALPDDSGRAFVANCRATSEQNFGMT